MDVNRSVFEWVGCLSYGTGANGECWWNEEDYVMMGFQLQIGDMMMISMPDGFGYSVEWCWLGGMIISKKQRECAGKWYLSVIWKQQRLQVVFLWQVNDKEIILLLVVDRTITDHSQILFHCGDVHRANGIECNIRRMTVLISSPNETHCMRNGRYWWRIPFSRVHCHERLISHNGHERVVVIVKEIGGVIEDRIRVGDRREDRQLLIVGCPHWFQFKSNERPQNRLSLRWVGSANCSWDIAVKG